MVPPRHHRPTRHAPGKAAAATGSVRIIAGVWRGSKLPVADVPGLRPSSDRVRETLFNWLQPMLARACVLDAFAGTGALGLEAASRGARKVVLIEQQPDLAASLRTQVERLARGGGAGEVEIVHDDALRWLARPARERFDLVLLDPPFAADLWQPALAVLQPWLAADALLYIEMPRNAVHEPGPGWLLHRQGQTRDVRFALYRRDAATLATIPAQAG